MQNLIAALSNADLLGRGESATSGATAIGSAIGLIINPDVRLSADFTGATRGVRVYQTAVADRVAKAKALDPLLAAARTWCFRAKDTLKPFLATRITRSGGPPVSSRPSACRRITAVCSPSSIRSECSSTIIPTRRTPAPR